MNILTKPRQSGKMLTFTRRYRRDDIASLVKYAEQFVPELPNYLGMTVEPERLRFVLENNINNEGTFMLRVLCDSHDNIVGAMMGCCATAIFSWQVIADDIFLFILPEFRTLANAKALLRTYKQWAVARKATIIRASTTSGYREEGMDKFLRSEGFDRVGTVYHLRTDK